MGHTPTFSQSVQRVSVTLYLIGQNAAALFWPMHNSRGQKYLASGIIDDPNTKAGRCVAWLGSLLMRFFNRKETDTLTSVDSPWYIYREREITQNASRRDQVEGGELDSHEEVQLSFASPGEVKGREVLIDLQESPEEINWAGRWSWAQKVGLVFCFSCSSITDILSLWHCSAQQLKQQLQAQYNTIQ